MEARSDNTNFVVDGFKRIAMSEERRRSFVPNIDAMAGIQDGGVRYSAEYGKMAGGVLNMVIRSGTNQYHGSLFEYFATISSDAKEYFSTDRSACTKIVRGDHPGSASAFRGLQRARQDILPLQHGKHNTAGMGPEQARQCPTPLERAGDFTQTRDVKADCPSEIVRRSSARSGQHVQSADAMAFWTRG